MIYMPEFDTNNKVLINPDQIRYVRPTPVGASKIVYANDQYIVVAVPFDKFLDELKGKPAKTEKKE